MDDGLLLAVGGQVDRFDEVAPGTDEGDLSLLGDVAEELVLVGLFPKGPGLEGLAGEIEGKGVGRLVLGGRLVLRGGSLGDRGPGRPDTPQGTGQRRARIREADDKSP